MWVDVGIYRQEEEEAGLILGVEAKIVARLSGWTPRAIIVLLLDEQNRPGGVHQVAYMASALSHLVYSTWCIRAALQILVILQVEVVEAN